MSHSGLQSGIQALWLVQMGLLSILGIVLISRKLWASFPFFTAYALFNLVSGPIPFFLYRNPRTYAYFYIVAETLSVLLGLSVVYEIFVHLFSAQAALRKLATILLVIVVVLLIGLGAAVVYTRASGVKNIVAAILVAEEAARALELGLLIFLFVCSSSFGLHWRQPLFGIAIGLGFFVTVQLVMMTVWGYIRSGGSSIVGTGSTLAYDLSLVVWIGYLLVPERAPSTELPEKSQLEQWNRAVMELIHQ